MPLYEYRCSSCGHQQEFLRKWSDAPFTVCTACGKDTFAKLLTAAGFQLKGSGWYATDFKNNGKKPAAKGAEGKSESKSDSKTDSKSESKSDSKTDAKGEGGGESKKESAPAACGAGGCAACS